MFKLTIVRGRCMLATSRYKSGMPEIDFLHLTLYSNSKPLSLELYKPACGIQDAEGFGILPLASAYSALTISTPKRHVILL